MVLIAGAVGGQGQSHAQLLYQLGARLVLADIDQGAAHVLATSLGGNIMGLDHDVCSSQDWVRVVDAAVGAWG